MKHKDVTDKPSDGSKEFDFSKAIRNPFAARIASEEPTIIYIEESDDDAILLDDDVASVFNDSRAVNEALRTLIRINGGSPRGKKTRTETKAKPAAAKAKPTAKAPSAAKPTSTRAARATRTATPPARKKI